jgi:hypothetical protein
MAEKTFTIDDMIASVLDRQPETFKDAFNDLMGQKAAEAVMAKKEEVSQTMFAATENDETELEDGSEDPSESEDTQDQDETEDENGDQT